MNAECRNDWSKEARHQSHKSPIATTTASARRESSEWGPKQNCRYLCSRTDWHRTTDGAIVNVLQFMASCKAQTILQRAVCIAQSTTVLKYTVCTLEEMALAAVSQFRFFYRRLCKMGLVAFPNGPSLL